MTRCNQNGTSRFYANSLIAILLRIYQENRENSCGSSVNSESNRTYRSSQNWELALTSGIHTHTHERRETLQRTKYKSIASVANCISDLQDAVRFSEKWPRIQRERGKACQPAMGGAFYRFIHYPLRDLTRRPFVSAAQPSRLIPISRLTKPASIKSCRRRFSCATRLPENSVTRYPLRTVSSCPHIHGVSEKFPGRGNALWKQNQLYYRKEYIRRTFPLFQTFIFAGDTARDYCDKNPRIFFFN